MADNLVMTDDGAFKLNAWAQWWRAYLSAPTQPGYQFVVRSGLERLRSLADFIAVQSDLLGVATSKRIAQEARAKLDRYVEIAESTADPSALFAGVAVPLLYAGPYSPIYRIPAAHAAMLAGAQVPVHGFWDHFADQWAALPAYAADVANKAAAATGKAIASATSPIASAILPLAAAAIVILWLIKSGGK